MIKLQIIGWRIRRKIQDGVQILKEDSGLSVIEMLLILVEKFIPFIGCVLRV